VTMPVSSPSSPDGELVARTDIGDETTLTRTLRFSRSPTFYARTGDWFALVCLGLGAAFVIAGLRSGRPIR
jgi:apolipoprotein N-acyltransferase